MFSSSSFPFSHSGKFIFSEVQMSENAWLIHVYILNVQTLLKLTWPLNGGCSPQDVEMKEEGTRHVLILYNCRMDMAGGVDFSAANAKSNAQLRVKGDHDETQTPSFNRGHILTPEPGWDRRSRLAEIKGKDRDKADCRDTDRRQSRSPVQENLINVKYWLLIDKSRITPCKWCRLPNMKCRQLHLVVPSSN